MKTRTSLVLALAGILTTVGGLKVVGRFERRANEIEQSIPARACEIRENISGIEGLSSKEILDSIVDPNNQELVEEYRGLIRELGHYDPDLIKSKLGKARIYRGFMGVGAIVASAGYALTLCGVAFPFLSYLDNRRKRKSR